MRARDQTVQEILDNLSELETDWRDELSVEVMAKLASLEKRDSYGGNEIGQLFEGSFEVGILCSRLFLGMSKDVMDRDLRKALGAGGAGQKRFQRDREAFLRALVAMRLPEAMRQAIHRQPIWSDILEERLRSGRGSAIQGQKRGRGLEDFVEAVLKEIFGEDGFESRCTFTGADGKPAKCDFAVPNRQRPSILVEVKGYGATGSKMTDVIGDLDSIIGAKRHDTSLLFVTDGTTWGARLSDLRKIVERQNQGKITRIYTTRMRDEFAEDLKTLRRESRL